MNPKISELTDQAKSLWQNASAPARIGLLGGGALLVILAISMTFWAAKPDFIPVFSGSAAQAQEMGKALDKAAIAYRISEDGGTILVARNDSGRARQVSGGVADTTSAGQGLRGLDSMGPFTTYEQQQARIERAHEEAIELSLKQYAGVQNVSVNLALAPDNALVGQDVPPKAAVTITPGGGVLFDDAQIAAMAYVVSSSVPRLTPDNVTIASSQGVALWSGGRVTAPSKNGESLIQARSQAEQEYVRTRQAELQGNLDRVFGPRKAIVYVDAVLDLDKEEKDARRIVPAGPDGKGLPVSENSSTKNYNGKSGGAPDESGPTGATANIPGYPTATAGSNNRDGNEQYKTSDETINYENSVENVRSVKTVGEPKRLNVSVIVDTQLAAAEQQAIKTFVEGAVINPTNAATTRVTVAPATFDRTLDTKLAAARTAAERQAMLAAWAPYIVLPLCIGLLLGVGYLLTRTRQRSDALVATGGAGAAAENVVLTVLNDTTAAEAASPENLLDILIGDSDDASLIADSGVKPTALEAEADVMTAIEQKDDPDLEVINDFIGRHPDAAALLLRTWISEDAARTKRADAA